jgi:DNA-binding MarR family transcriptional regulator
MDRPTDHAAPPDALLDEASRALFDLGRFFARLPLRERLAGEAGADRSRILASLAVDDGTAAGRDVSVGSVAERLGLDPSTASRLVGQAVAAGLLQRGPSPVDGRLARLALTPAGRDLVADARRYQRAVFDDVTRDWSDAERREFARLFVRFAAGVVAAAGATGDAQSPPPAPPRRP